eukprot:11930665-Karenia_brevis.AAC.1
MWAEGNEDAIAAEMRVEGHSKSYRRTAIRYVKTQRSLVTDYVNGKIDADTSSIVVESGVKRPAAFKTAPTH